MNPKTGQRLKADLDTLPDDKDDNSHSNDDPFVF